MELDAMPSKKLLQSKLKQASEFVNTNNQDFRHRSVTVELDEVDEVAASIKEAREALESLQSVVTEVKEVEEAYARIKECHDDNMRHSDKRWESEFLSNLILTKCSSKQCPVGCVQPTSLWFLCDISIERLIRMLAETDRNVDSVKAYYGAEAKIKSIMECPGPTMLDEKLADTDVAEVTSSINHYTQFAGSRKRKAFWSYLEKKPVNNPQSDYQDACGYIESMSSYYELPNLTNAEIEAAKELIWKNKHLASVVDLVKLCIMKKRAKLVLSTS